MTSRREILSLALGFAFRSSAQELTDEASLTDLQGALSMGRITSVDLVHQYLARIARIDKAGPMLNAVIELNPDAEAIAAALDKERKASGMRGPLHGIPILIKDNIDTGDKMMTTAGSLALVGPPAPKDALLVERLRASGAVLLGKTNLSEWANFRSTRSTSGWSGRGGQTRNPYVLDRNPSGSSSGSAVAASANLCAAAVGTETDGSIVSPASVNGIVGIKPTVGLIPGTGIIPISHRQDTAGPMARSVADATLLLSVLTSRSYGSALDARDGLKGARLGVVRDLFAAGTEVGKQMDQALAVLKSLGAVLIDPVTIPNASKLGEPELEGLLWDFKNDLDAYLAARGGQIKSLQDVIAFNDKNRDRELVHFGQELMIQAQAKGKSGTRAYDSLTAKLSRLSKGDGIDRVMSDHKLDALMSPTGGVAWPTNYATGDGDIGNASTPAAVAGYPHITVPAGEVLGLPVGLSFFGAPRTEARLIRYAYTFEQETKARPRSVQNKGFRKKNAGEYSEEDTHRPAHHDR
jgi:amidase